MSSDSGNKNRRYKSILQEINNYVPAHSKDEIIESRGHHIISSAINLMQLIRETYGDEEADTLEKRFLSSIRGEDPRRFARSVRKIKESKHENK